ncbi:MAG: c-type cytochrome [Planctomycetaceae bacterium]|nr:c-type cytochrome [Planctomycetaceae bacterium]
MLRSSFLLSIFLMAAAALNAAEPNVKLPKSPLSPEESLKWIELADAELRVEIAAAEPEVVDPVAVRFDERGRMWVAEYRDYPNGPAEGGKPLSRIKLLEDKDHDGRFETAHVFADELPFCNGIQPWDGGVLATMAGRIAFLKDTDGDNRADVNTTLLVGFAEENPQLRVNHPRFALDNFVYVANGLRGGSAVDATRSDAKPVSLKGHDLRFDPITKSYEPIAGNGQFGLTIDDFGNRFLCSNRNPLYHVVLEDRYLARNPNLTVPKVVNDVAAAGEESHVFPIVQAWTTSILHAGQFTAACGIDLYRGDLLPPAYYGNSFTCEPTGSLVHREIIQPAGATFIGKPAYEGREFLASRDPWFRPVCVENGPDGALYVCDMYRAVIEHPQFMPEELKNRPDLRYGDDRGRIYRIVPKNFRCAEEFPSLANASPEKLTKALTHRNAWWRETAQRMIRLKAPNADVARLRELAKTAELPQTRVQAIRTLQGAGALNRDDVMIALGDKHPRVRELGVMLAERHLGDSSVLELVLKQAGDGDARLRFQTALSLGEIEQIDERTLTALVEILERGGDDFWTRTAVASAAPHDAARILAKVIERTRPTDPAEAARRRGLLRELAASASRTLDPQNSASVREALKPWEQNDEGRRLILAVLAGVGKGWKGGWGTFFGTEGATALEAEVLAVAGDVNVEKEARVDAFDILGGFASTAGSPREKELASMALTVVKTDGDGDLRGKALAYLASRRSPDTAELLLALLPKQSPAIRGQIFDALLSRPERVAALLDAVEQGRIKARELDQTRATRLLKNVTKDSKARAEKLLASAMPADRTKALEQYKPALSLKADAVRGKEVFKKNCATCHKIGDVGIEVGPSIADLRTKTLEQVLVDVLQPNKAIDNNFISYTVVTDDGLQYVGIVVADTPGSVTLKMPDGKTVSVLKTEIDEMSSNGVSLMPEGLERNIPPQEMADVISFVKNWRYLDGAVPDAPGAPKGVQSN